MTRLISFVAATLVVATSFIAFTGTAVAHERPRMAHPARGQLSCPLLIRQQLEAPPELRQRLCQR